MPWTGCRCNVANKPAAPALTLTAEDFAHAHGMIEGSIAFHGSLPEPRVWRTGGKDPWCQRNGQDQIASEDVIINTNGTLRNVFVYISSSFGALQFPIPAAPVILDQRGCRYLPHVFGLRVGQTLEILNSDSTLHNVHASPERNRAFNIGMTRLLKKASRSFDRQEIMIPLHCNVHPWMSAFAGVVDHPFFAVTNTAGTFELGPLPPGEYEVLAWHERFGILKHRVKLQASETQQVEFIFQTQPNSTNP